MMKTRLQWALGAALATLGYGLACTTSNAGVGPSSNGSVANIGVTPESATVVSHAGQTFSAVAHDAAGGTVNGVSFVWSSSNTAIATVDQDGHATALDTGRVQITASAQEVSAGATLIVTRAAVGSVVVVPSIDTISPGSTRQLSDTVKDGSGNSLTVPATWASSDTSVAAVSSSGLISAKRAGTATITASAGGKMGTNTTLVSDSGAPASISLVLTPDSAVVIPNPLDELIQLTATVKTANGHVLSNYPVIVTSNNATVSGSLGAGPDTVIGGSILFIPNGNGRAVITATAGRVSARAALTICYAAGTAICNPLDSIYVTPPVDTLVVGDSVLMNAIGVDSSGNRYPNMFVEWDPGPLVSSDSDRAIVIAPYGEVYALNPGTQYVEASIQGFSSGALITVVPSGPGPSIASTRDYQEHRARTLAAVALGNARQRAARNGQEEHMQASILNRMQLAHGATLKAYYARLIDRLATVRDHQVKTVIAR